jgi:hypothetical protein
MKVKTASTATAGRAMGRTIELRMRSRLAPSTRAASSSSLGMLRKNCRSRKVPKAENAHGSTRAW